MFYQINITDSNEQTHQAFIREGDRGSVFKPQGERKTQVNQLDPQSRREYVEFLRLRYASGAMEVDCEAVAVCLLKVMASEPGRAQLRPARTSFGLLA